MTTFMTVYMTSHNTCITIYMIIWLFSFHIVIRRNMKRWLVEWLSTYAALSKNDYINWVFVISQYYENDLMHNYTTDYNDKRLWFKVRMYIYWMEWFLWLFTWLYDWILHLTWFSYVIFFFFSWLVVWKRSFIVTSMFFY